MLIDTHIHLDFDEFSPDFSEVMKRAAEAGVKYFLNVGTTLEKSLKSVELARKYENIYASVGFHPHDAANLDDENFKKIKELTSEEKVVAIGEVGLDYFRDISPREAQKLAFEKFLSLYKETGLPLIIHSRESYDELLSMLENLLEPPVRGVMHCFSADESVLRRALGIGLHVSFAGQISYKKNENLRNLAKLVPDRRLLLETDAPFLPPKSKRGERNEPAFLVETARLIANLRGVTLEDLGRITTLNTRRLFGFPKIAEKSEIAYRIRDSVYLNLTNRCTNECSFCVRFYDDYVKGHKLKLDDEPTADELVQAVLEEEKKGAIKEVVFCGYGEPTLRLNVILDVAKKLKEKGFRLRLNTNGHGNVINKRNILPDLKGLIDEISISLNAHDSETYNKICRPKVEGDMFSVVKEFIRESKKYIPKVVVTSLDLNEIDLPMVRAIVEELGAELKIRHFDIVG